MPTFAHPLLLILALAAPLAVWALHRHAVRARAQAWAALAPGGLRAGLTGAQPWMRGRRALAVAVAGALVAVALARPQVAGGEEAVEREGLDLVVALDVSQSMLAEDVAPSRLERARAEVRRLADALPGDRLGLVVFAGDAFVQCPLTSDHAAFRLFLDAASPDMLPTQGTDFEAALAAAADAFGPPPAERRVASDGGVTTAPPAAARVVLVVSDGENHDGRIARARALARDAGAVVFTAGVGESEGVPIPAFVEGQRVGNKVDPETGEEVRSRLEPDALRDLASDGGAYVHVGRLESGLGELPAQLSGMQRGVIAAAAMGRRAEAFMWPLALALLVLAAEALVPDARRPAPSAVPLASAPAPSTSTALPSTSSSGPGGPRPAPGEPFSTQRGPRPTPGGPLSRLGGRISTPGEPRPTSGGPLPTPGESRPTPGESRPTPGAPRSTRGAAFSPPGAASSAPGEARRGSGGGIPMGDGRMEGTGADSARSGM